MFNSLQKLFRRHLSSGQNGQEKSCFSDSSFGSPGKVDFERLWEMPLSPLDEPNHRKAGFSQAFLWKTEEGKWIVKRQFDYFCRTFLHPLTGIPTLEKEFHNLLRLQQEGIAVPRPLYFGCRRQDGHTQAVLITEYANGFISLDTLLSRWAIERPSPAHRKEITAAVASAIRNLHQHRLCHRHLVPKHILLRPDCKPIQVILIDLEATEPFRPFRKNRQSDLASLNYRCRLASQTDKLRFLFSYLGISRWTLPAKMFARDILQKSHRKSQKAHQRRKNKRSCA